MEHEGGVRFRKIVEEETLQERSKGSGVLSTTYGVHSDKIRETFGID